MEQSDIRSGWFLALVTLIFSGAGDGASRDVERDRVRRANRG